MDGMKKLVVKYQNPAVYMEEFLTMKQEGDKSIRHEFLVTCKCCKDGDRKCGCTAKVSYADDIMNFKLVSGFADSDIKEDALGLEFTKLE